MRIIKYFEFNWYKYTLFASVFLLSFQQIAKAQEVDKFVAVELDNGKYLQIQVCTESIVRVRISEQKEFPQSLMERYGQA